MKRTSATALFLLLFIGFVKCQYNDEAFRKLGVKAHYFGEFILHPGLGVGITYSLVDRQWFNLHWDSELGGFHHAGNNNALFLQTSIGTRITAPFALFADVNAGFGGIVSSPQGEEYTANESGELTSSDLTLYAGWRPSISLLFGWDGSKKRGLPFLIHCGFEVYGQTHFNHSILPHAAVRLGAVYQLKKEKT